MICSRAGVQAQGISTDPLRKGGRINACAVVVVSAVVLKSIAVKGIIGRSPSFGLIQLYRFLLACTGPKGRQTSGADSRIPRYQL